MAKFSVDYLSMGFWWHSFWLG